MPLSPAQSVLINNGWMTTIDAKRRMITKPITAIGLLKKTLTRPPEPKKLSLRAIHPTTEADTRIECHMHHVEDDANQKGENTHDQ